MQVLDFPAAEPAPAFLWGTVATIASVLLILLAVGLWARRRRRSRARFVGWFLPGMAVFQLGLFGVLSWWNERGAPRSYELSDEAVTVISRVRVARFELAAFDTVGRDTDGRWRITYRESFACQKQGRISRGPWGVHGTTRAPGLPWAHVYVTDPARVVALGGRTHLLVSPAEPDRFVAAVERRLADLRGHAGLNAG